MPRLSPAMEAFSRRRESGCFLVGRWCQPRTIQYTLEFQVLDRNALVAEAREQCAVGRQRDARIRWDGRTRQPDVLWNLSDGRPPSSRRLMWLSLAQGAGYDLKALGLAGVRVVIGGWRWFR
jgi:hypothetical protein